VSVILTHHQAALLDEIAAAIRRHTGKSISRWAMFRAIADAVLPLYPDWFASRSEDELQERIRLQIGRGAGARAATAPTANP
jgi:hypothetical protein